MRLAPALALVSLAMAGPVRAKPPIVVELFTAQGCSPCGKVDDTIDQLAASPGVLILTWSVDYWDYLGWKDTFAQPEFTDRQRAYDRRFGLNDVYTPQVVVEGRLQASGAASGVIEQLIDKERKVRAPAPDMLFVGEGRVAVGSGSPPRGGGDVWLVRYDPRVQDVEVKAGDNRGQKVSERNVVRQVERLGPWRGRPVVYRLPPPPEEGLATAVLVQQARGGAILGALEADQPGA